MRAELGSSRCYVQAEAGWFLAYLGSVQVVYMDGRIDDASYGRYLTALAADIEERSRDDRRISILYHVPEPAALTSKRRNQLADVLRAHEEATRRYTVAYTLATTSSLVRGGLKVLFWLAPPPYPNAVVATPRAGFSFLANFDPELDAAQLLARYERLLHEHSQTLGAR